MRVIPEEMTGAFIMAVARDIEKGASAEILSKWRAAMLSTPCKLMVLSTPIDRYWQALRLREDLIHTNNACHRSCYQRLHEVLRLMDAMRTRLPESQVTTNRVHDEYKNHANNMDTSSEGAITHGFVKVAITVAKRMLSVPDIASIMRESDSGHPPVFNPWGNHTRLQAMVDKCKSADALLWCC